ncbi:MAG: carboxypeptidase regulatory-like domain-containing protein, partial [Acidobacteria bacterium]|nr:carboxypeptidase regulatory-like domain-containing protein [Acidobacteriota bacterium]
QQTAPDGAFEFRGLAAGRFALRALKEGYQTATVAVEVPAGQDVEGVEVLLRDGWAIRGRVLDGDRLPVAGAQVAGQPLGRGGSSRMVTSSDGGGRFILEGLPAGTIELVAAHRDHPELRQRIELEGADREIELVFPRGVSVSGVVESAEGGVVGGAEVMLVKAGSWRSDLSTTSRSDGSFTIEDVPSGQWILAATADGYSRSSLSNPLEIRSQPVSGLRLEISRGTRVVGRITGLDPNRWPGLQVRAILRTGASPQLRQGKLLTGEGYRIDGLSAGTWMIQAEVEGSALLETLVVEEGVEEVRRDFEFVEGLTLSGVVTDAAQPQSGLNVSVWSIDTGKAGGGVTDESGRFTVQGLVEGTYTVQIHSSSGVPRHRSEIELPASREIEIRLDEGSAVAGQVVDGQDGQPMASVVVTLARAQGDRHGMTETRHSSSDSTGRFSFDRVEVGDWILHVKAHGYEPLEQPITVHEGEALPELRLELSPRNTLRLKLRAREGVLPDRVSVSAFTAGGQAVGTTFRPPVSEEGWVDLDSLPRVPCTVLVASADHALTEAQLTPGVETELLLPRGASLAVRVPELQEDRTGATLRLFSPSLGRALRWPNYPSGVRDSLPFILGAGQLAAIPPGAWTVLVRAADGREWSA